MDKRISKKNLRTSRLAAACLLISLTLPCAAFAFKSAYEFISVPGNINDAGWNTETNKLELVSDYVWQGVIDVKNNGEFKFAANGSWAVNWGVGREVSSVPAEDMGPLVREGSNISLKLAAGKYRFVFFEDTETFSVLPKESRVPPSTLPVRLVGNFNNDGELPIGVMTNIPGKAGAWSTTLDLSYGATFRVEVPDKIFGAHSAAGATVTVGNTNIPSFLALYGSTEAFLAARDGTFEITVDFRSNLLSVVQTAVNPFALAVAGADGTFACSTNLPGQNLEAAGDDWWSGDFMVGQDSFTLRFVGRDADGVAGRWWGFPAGTTVSSLPANGTLAASDTPEGASFATFETGAGDYTFRFNPQSGSYTVRKRALSNLLANASFENLDGDGNPTYWGLYHAGGAPSAAYDAHSGTNSAVLNRLYEEWDNLGNIDQNVKLTDKEGLPFRVSAAFRCGGTEWHGDTVRIIVEWKDADGRVVSEESEEVLNLSPAWQTVALDTTVPSNNITAHILFKYDGARLGETVLIDDAFAGIAATRTQNFDAWGRHDDFGPLSPDWSASSAKTILNAAATVPGGVVISRYIESVGNTKAIELYNGTAAEIDFSKTPYYLQQYDNGATSPTVTIAITNGKIPANRTFAITRTFPSGSKYLPDSALRQFGAIRGNANRILRTDALTFNGDDVIVLRKDTASGRAVDRVGQVSSNATGSLWSRMATDHTLVRNGTVTNGNTSSVTSAFDLSEWTVLDNGDFGDLGNHAFTDPDAGYLPSGYSLLLDTNATLATPALEGGIGDISFLARAQGAAAGSDLKLAVETAPDEYSTNWTEVATVAIPLSQTEFTRYECSAGNSAHSVVRFRHAGDGTTNRVRLDDIGIDRAYRIKRTENFAAWTEAAYRTDGLHTVAQWTLNGRVASNGVSATLAGNLPVDSGYVRSPTFDGGVGQVTFTLCRPDAADSVQVTLSSSADGGATWTEVQTFEYPSGGKGTATNLSAWVYVPSNGCVRFDCVGGTADAILDNISVGMPSLSRELNFDDFAANSSYKVSYSYKGWNITGTAIVAGDNAWSGNSGLLQNGTISSPRIDPLGSISFLHRKGPYDGDDRARLKVEVSSDGSSWTTLTNGLAPAADWETFGYWFPTNSDWHYVRISQTTKDKRMLLDDIALNDFAPAPSVSFSASLDPVYPSVREEFRLTATAYPHNGADILSVTGFVRIGTSGRLKILSMTDEGAGDWVSSEKQPGRNAGESIISYATVWYGGVGAVPGNPGYAVTNISTPPTTVTVSTVRSDAVWINEFSYAELYEIDYWGENHEFIEICGPTNIDLANWKIQLAYALPADIAANSNQAVYATYTITNATQFTNVVDGYGFWLLADANDEAFPNRQGTLDVLDPIDPENFDDGWDDWDDDESWLGADGEDDWGDDSGDWGIHSHIHNNSGVIRLLNQYGGVMHSISYGAYAESSEHVAQTQERGIDTNAISLQGTGNLYSDFSWTMLDFTPGLVNADQYFQTVTNVFMPIWHDPNQFVATVSRGSFYLFNPKNANQTDDVQVFYAYPYSAFPDYGTLGGALYHRLHGTGDWKTVPKNTDFSGNHNPTNDEAYFAFSSTFDAITNHTYKRTQTMDYVIEATTTERGYATTYLGSTGDGTTSKIYDTLEEAQKHPFTHTFPIADEIQITSFEFLKDEGKIRIETESHDTTWPVQEFQIQVVTNLTQAKTNYIPFTDFEHEGHDVEEVRYDEFTFTPPLSDAPALHFAIQPVR